MVIRNHDRGVSDIGMYMDCFTLSVRSCENLNFCYPSQTALSPELRSSTVVYPKVFWEIDINVKKMVLE